jgi:hypothetical protein
MRGGRSILYQLQRQRRTMSQCDPAVTSIETPPVVNVGANDTAAQVEYLRAKETQLTRNKKLQ